jgi:uncharacterized protein (TIGR03435 family)
MNATLIMRIGITRIGLSALLAAGTGLAQTPLAFEVATVKPSAPLDVAAIRAGRAHVGTKMDAARVDIGSASLFRLICTAYRMRPYQVTGPEWLKTTMYDIQAKIPEGGTVEKIPEMLQALLAERFGLKIHYDSKDQGVYALVVGKGGIKMKESAPEPASAPVTDATPAAEKAAMVSMSMPTAQGDVKLTRTAQGASIEMPGGEINGKIRMTTNGGSGAQMRIHLESSGTTMTSFAQMLSVGILDRPVVDKTELTGRYEVGVDISPEDAMNVARASTSFGPRQGGGGDAGKLPEAVASDPSGSSLFASIQKLGLKLEPRKLPLEMLVVDHIDKTPGGN